MPLLSLKNKDNKDILPDYLPKSLEYGLSKVLTLLLSAKVNVTPTRRGFHKKNNLNLWSFLLASLNVKNQSSGVCQF